MGKYRLKINKKITKTLSKEEIIDMVELGEVSSEAECQVFPEGEWGIITKFPEFRNLDFSASFPEEYSGEEINFETDAESNIEKTIIRNKPEQQQELDKTIIRDIGLELDTNETNIDFTAEQMGEDAITEEPVSSNDETKKIDLGQIRSELSKEAQESEEKFDLEIAKSIVKAKERRIEVQAKNSIIAKDIEQEIQKGEQLKDRKKNPLLFVILAVIFMWLYFDDDQAQDNRKRVYFKTYQIKMPIELVPPSPGEAKLYYDEARVLEARNDYLSRIEATKLYFKSVQNQFYKNPALGRLVLLYSEFLPLSEDKKSAARVINDLLKIFKGSALDKLDYVTARAQFFYNTGKFRAAQTVIENYNLTNNPSVELFSIYLNVLIEVGDFIRAEKVLTALNKASNWPENTYLAVVNYHSAQQDFAKVSQYLTEGVEKYPDSIPLKLEVAKIHFKNRDLNPLGKVLASIKDKNYNFHPHYFADYLMFSGMIAAAKKETDKATQYFNRSLEVRDSDFLRGLLASVDNSESEILNTIVAESKAVVSINSSKEAYKNSDFELAILKAIEATELAPNFSKAIINLADMQIDLGFFQDAITSLLKSISNPNLKNKLKVKFKLMDAYIRSFKFSDASRFGNEIRSYSDIATSTEYFELIGDLFYAQGKYASALTRYKKALNLDPLNDQIAYKIARLFLDQKSFTNARKVITKAIELNPGKVQYRIFYSKILFEMEDSRTALGYLRDTLSEFPENEDLLSTIGILYYKSGQQKYFLDVKKHLIEGNRGIELYKFLVEAAILDDNDAAIMENAKRLIDLNPGDIKTRMLFDRVQINNQLYKDAVKTLKEVSLRIDSYPRLKLLQSKIALEMKDYEAALRYIKKEIEANPYIIDSYILMGNIHKRRGDFEDAKIAYKKAQKINPRSTEALLGFAFIKFRQNQHEAAIDLYKKVVTLDPSIPQAHLQLGNVYRFLGRGQLAIESYKVYLDLIPDAAEKPSLERYIRKLE